MTRETAIFLRWLHGEPDFKDLFDYWFKWQEGKNYLGDFIRVDEDERAFGELQDEVDAVARSAVEDGIFTVEQMDEVNMNEVCELLFEGDTLALQRALNPFGRKLIFTKTKINGKTRLQATGEKVPEPRGSEPWDLENRLNLDHVAKTVSAHLDRAERSAQKCLDALNRAYQEGE